MKLIQSNGLALLGAAVGGALGYFLFFWLAGHGFYGMIIPGGLLGIGAGVFKSRSIVIAIICGVAALALGLFTEWRFAPFVADESLGYFLAHVYQLTAITLIMIALGAAIGFWAPFRHWFSNRPVSPS
jgi:hypothetical protein